LSTTRIQSTLESVCSINPTRGVSVRRDTVVSYVPMEDIAAGGGQLRAQTRSYGELPKGLTAFREGDVLVAKITPCFQNMKRWLAQDLASGVGFGSTELHVLRAGSGVLPRILYAHTLSSRFLRLGTRFMTGSAGQQRVSADFLRGYRIWLPSLTAQSAIARVDEQLEAVWWRIDALVAAKREQKRGLMQQLLRGKVRFPGFTEPWKTVRLGDVANEVTSRNKGRLGIERVRGVIKGAGLLPMRERVMASDLSRYQIVAPNAFAYNPMRLNIGSIAINEEPTDCLVSPDYVVFQTDGQRLRPQFLNYYRHAWHWEKFVQRAGSGSVRTRIYFDDLAELALRLPAAHEQDRIVRCLDSISREMQLLEAQRDALADQRRGLMDKLLAGEIDIPHNEETAA